MEQLFYSIQQHVAAGMPALATIDEDYGQLCTEEDTYPVLFPCALINAEQTDWESLSGGAQRGKCTVVITLGIDCYDDTHYGSGTEEKALERQRMATELNKLLHCKRLEGAAGPLVRKMSRNYSLPGGIKVYEMRYEVMVAEQGQELVSAQCRFNPVI